MKHYPHHIGDFDKATRHLTRIERSVYRDLIDLYYDTEAPIPLDLAFVCRKIIARSNEESTAVEQVLNEFFTKTATGWYHDRCEHVISDYRANTSQKAQAGKASAEAKRLKKLHALNGDSTGVETPVEQANNGTSTNRKPETVNQYSVTDVTDGEPSKLTDPDEIIFGYGVPLLTNAGTADKQARSFLGGLRKIHGDQAVIDKLRDCFRERPLQPLEWLAAALPPKAATSKRKTPPAEDFSKADYGQGGKL